MADVDVGAVAPAESVVPAAQPAPAPESPADQAAESLKEGEQPSKPSRTYTEEEYQKGLQKRLGIESRRLEKIARAEARADLAERQLRESQQPRTQQPQAGEPQPNDPKFGGNYEEYLLAKAEYRLEQRQAKDRETQQREIATSQQHREEVEIARHIQQNVYAKGVEKYDDFDDVAMGDNVPISRAMAAFIAESPVGMDVWYTLGQNTAEAKRIHDLSPAGQFRALVALETKLNASPAPTRTPAPIVPNSGKAPGRKDTFELSVGNSQEWSEFIKRRHKELGRR